MMFRRANHYTTAAFYYFILNLHTHHHHRYNIFWQQPDILIPSTPIRSLFSLSILHDHDHGQVICLKKSYDMFPPSLECIKNPLKIKNVTLEIRVTFYIQFKNKKKSGIHFISPFLLNTILSSLSLSQSLSYNMSYLGSRSLLNFVYSQKLLNFKTNNK
jgi:hypothetical protein